MLWTLQFCFHVYAQKLHMSSVKLHAYVDPWDMLSNFYFQVYAQKSQVMGENDNAFFDIIISTTQLVSQLKIY